jgi:hypothetical protein
VTGLHALYQMYTSARAWAQDLQILHYTSVEVANVPRQPGKAAAWQVVFISPQLGKSRTWTFSISEASPTLHAGIFSGSSETWPGGGHPLMLETVKIDTDKAWDVALKHAEKYNSANPNMPVAFILAVEPGANTPAWRVLWGESVGTSNFSVLVNATTGEFIRVLH